MEWIKASERLPEESGEYLVVLHYDDKDFFESDTYTYTTTMVFNLHSMLWEGDAIFNAAYGNVGPFSHITHWMPLPEPPKGE